MQVTDRGCAYERVLEMAWSLGTLSDEEELIAASMEQLLLLFGGDEAGYNDISLTGSHFVARIHPLTPVGEEVRGQLGSVIREHPVVERLALDPSTEPMRMSDLLPTSGFHRTRTYETIFRPRGLQHQLTMPLQVNPSRRCGTVYVVNRCRTDFDAEDLQLAAMTVPVLAALHASLRARRPSPEQAAEVRARTRLTERELEMLELVASGLTADAIGHARRISARTVRKHLENAYAKLGVHDRLQAVEFCRRHRLLSDQNGAYASTGRA